MIDYISEHIYVFPFLISFAVFVISMIKDPRKFRNALLLMLTLITLAAALLFGTAGTPYQFMIGFPLLLLTVFLVLIVPCLLIYDTFIMIKREGFGTSSLLSGLFAILIFTGEGALVWYVLNFSSSTNIWLNLAMLETAHAVIYISVVFLAFMFYSVAIQWLPRKVDLDYIVVLGCGLINGDGVGRLLGNRLDKAAVVYDRSMSACKIICSGGQGKDETVSEAEAMSKYLIEKGISKKDIILEDQSVNTEENLRNSQEIIRKRKGRQRTAIVSSGYHILRASIYASRLNFPAYGVGAKTALYYWPSAMIREYAALVRYHWRPYFLIMIMIGVILAVLLHY